MQLPGTDVYSANKGSYIAEQQGELSLDCFVAVARRLSIAISIAVSRVTQCPFAIRAGDNSDLAGASNIETGITVDLRKLSYINVAADKKSVTVGSEHYGARSLKNSISMELPLLVVVQALSALVA